MGFTRNRAKGTVLRISDEKVKVRLLSGEQRLPVPQPLALRLVSYYCIGASEPRGAGETDESHIRT